MHLIPIILNIQKLRKKSQILGQLLFLSLLLGHIHGKKFSNEIPASYKDQKWQINAT